MMGLRAIVVPPRTTKAHSVQEVDFDLGGTPRAMRQQKRKGASKRRGGNQEPEVEYDVELISKHKMRPDGSFV